ncbi:MAG: cation:proton antiporter [Acidobacteriota bacterium]|nr:cation:proton antiporter [Acidobacteriota bacterium]
MKGPGNTPGDEQARVAPTAWALAVLLMIGLLMAYLRSLPQNAGQAGTTPLALGFLLLSAWCAGLLVEKLRLPKLTGYILAGLAAGPALTGLISAEKLVALQPINDLALTFIALVAGGELHFPMVRRLWRSIAGWIGGQLLLTPLVVGGGLFLIAPWLPGEMGGLELAALAIVLSAISLARSPAATVAVINEAEAKGPFTETVMATTITLDTLVVLIFAVAVAVAEKLTTPGAGFDLSVLTSLSADLLLSILLGGAVGCGVLLVMRTFRIDLPILLAGIAYLITRLSREASLWLADNFDTHLHLEPLLMGLTAGIVVQNLSRRGHVFTENLERIAPPIYVAFFALTGAGLDLDALTTSWLLAVSLVLLRMAGLFVGAWGGSAAAGDPRIWRSLAGWTAISQAGVSLGLAAELGRRFPQWGATVVAPLIAAIAINQIVGPVLLVRSLRRAGESHEHPLEPEESDIL